MNINIKLLIFGACLLAVHFSDSVLQNELCPTHNSPKIKYFEVEAAFQAIPGYIGLLGLMGRHDQRSTWERVAIRVRYWHQPDPSGKAPGNYYQVQLWDEVQQIDAKKSIKMAFFTKNIEIFNEDFRQTVFFVQVCPHSELSLIHLI